MGDYQQWSPAQYFQIYVVSKKWPHFPKLEVSVFYPGFQDSATTSAVTNTSKDFIVSLQGTHFNLYSCLPKFPT